MKLRTITARLLFLAFVAGIAAGACAPSEDGQILSDDEKIKRAQGGRESYMKGEQAPGNGK